MGKGGGKTPVDVYFMSMHTQICQGPVELLGWYYGEKEAWSGSKTAYETSFIDQSELFGGFKKEGGLGGYWTFLPGKGDQVLDTDLATTMGYDSPAVAPGFRGISGAFFTRGMYGMPGFMWGANTPYIKDLWFKVRRKPAGLDQDKALIPRDVTAEDTAVYFICEQPGGGDYWYPHWVGVQQAVQAASEQLIGIVNNGGVVDVGVSLMGVQGYLNPSPDDIPSAAAHGATTAAEISAVTSLVSSRPDTAWSIEFKPPFERAKAFFDAVDPSITKRKLIFLATNADASGSWTGGFDPAADYAAALAAFDELSGVESYVLTFGPGTDGNVIPTTHIAAFDNTDVDGLPQFNFIAGDGMPVDQYNTAKGLFIDATLAALGAVYGSSYDANPANIIYECLTNTVWGMGSPDSQLDLDSFSASQSTLFNEGFGLSMLWAQQSTIEDFVSEVLDHIQGVLFVHPRTGLLTLKLLRADYNVDELPTLTVDNAKLSSYQRKAWGEISNEIVLTWTNPANEQDETITVQDLGAIAIQGEVISASRNYYGIRKPSLGMAVAQRDLRASAYPLAQMEAEANRSQFGLFPGACVKVSWDEYGIDQLVMRVIKANYGKPGDLTVKLSLIEDIFSLDQAEYDEPPTTGWVNPHTRPTAMDYTRAMTVPYFFTMLATEGEVGTYPEVISGVLAADSAPDCGTYDLYAEETDTGGATSFVLQGERANLGHASLSAPLISEATSAGVVFADVIGSILPAASVFVLIGDKTTPNADMELALITAEPATGLFTLKRGILDTVPKPWPAGTAVWFFEKDTTLYDPNIRSDGETVDYKLLTRTSLGMLSETSAPILHGTMDARPWLPSRPANVKVEGVGFSTVVIDAHVNGLDHVVVTWADRNRVTEDSVILGWTDAPVTPETGQTTTINVYKPDGTTLMTSVTGLTGGAYNLPKASWVGANYGWVEVKSERDGYESLQGHRLLVRVNPLTADETGITADTTMHTADEGL